MTYYALLFKKIILAAVWRMDFREGTSEEAETIIRSLFAVVTVKDAVDLIGDGHSGGGKWWMAPGNTLEENVRRIKEERKLRHLLVFGVSN